MDSILSTIKKMLGLDDEYNAFDIDIVVHINTAFMILNQLGVGPTAGFAILGKEEIWDDYLDQGANLESVKSYIYMKTRLAFDPPISSAAIASMNQMISELEWRINVAVDPPSVTGREEI